jgi:hypothetical protein
VDEILWQEHKSSFISTYFFRFSITVVKLQSFVSFLCLRRIITLFKSFLQIHTSIQWLVTHSHTLLWRQLVLWLPRARPTHNVEDKAGPVLLPVWMATTALLRMTGTPNVFLAL